MKCWEWGEMDEGVILWIFLTCVMTRGGVGDW